MKILFAMPSLRSGGAERTFLSLGKVMLDNGNDVTILVCEPFDTTRLGHGTLPIPDGLKRISLNKTHVMSCFFDVARIIEKEKFDLVVSTIAHMNVMMSLSKIFNRQRHKLCIRDCSIHEEPKSFRDRIFNLLMRIAYKKANALVCVSNINKLNLAQIGVVNDNTNIIYNTIYSDAFRRKADENLPEDIAYLGKEPFLTTVARLDPIKNQAFMIRAFAKIADKIPHKFVIVGDGPLRNGLQALANSLNIADKVIFTGYRNNPLTFMKRADLYLMSSLKEAASRSAMEALCLGTPTICVDTCGSFAEILDNGKCGIILDKFDEGAYADAILRELTHPSFKKSDLEMAAKKFYESENLKLYNDLFKFLASS